MAENPISTAGNVAGKTLMVAPVPAAVKTVPVGGASMAAETYLKKTFPTYSKATQKAGKWWDGRTKVRKFLNENTPSLNQMSQLVPV